MRLILLLLLSLNFVHAQNITGTWEGVMGHEIIQINIKQENGGKICGYTHDWFLNDKKEQCKAYFNGRYDRERNVWVLTGTRFLENSGSHVLMRILLWREKGARNSLVAAVTTSSSLGIIFSDPRRESFDLRRVSATPNPLPGNLPLCPDDPIKRNTPSQPPPVTRQTPAPNRTVPQQQTQRPPVVKSTPVTPKSVPVKPPVQNPTNNPPVVKTEPKPVKPQVLQTIPEPPDAKVVTRKRNAINTLEVDVPQVLLDVYDNGIIDGDTVSIFLNGKMLVNKKILAAKPLSFKLDLNEGKNEIVMYAENLGSIPPNTALMVVTAGGKRFEQHASANLQENAVLVIDYKPK